MTPYDARVDVAALFATGAELTPQLLGGIFQRIDDEARAAGRDEGLREAEGIARAAECKVGSCYGCHDAGDAADAIAAARTTPAPGTKTP